MLHMCSMRCLCNIETLENGGKPRKNAKWIGGGGERQYGCGYDRIINKKIVHFLHMQRRNVVLSTICNSLRAISFWGSKQYALRVMILHCQIQPISILHQLLKLMIPNSCLCCSQRLFCIYCVASTSGPIRSLSFNNLFNKIIIILHLKRLLECVWKYFKLNIKLNKFSAKL